MKPIIIIMTVVAAWGLWRAFCHDIIEAETSLMFILTLLILWWRAERQ